ncbi:hypothetical protein [Aurantiacibacter luteus]|uniref:Uncharacterized protein n=1 Tax=Aurantiacibacter luteus TaxID=1581420 RepID=A0A0G9MSZ1_9SPHN|nr:hypothetical protein [Aurantiacibacter luteus]KLE32448.1 hypothetical protein AAW00_13540 [Aurantiacibacter luteus]
MRIPNISCRAAGFALSLFLCGGGAAAAQPDDIFLSCSSPSFADPIVYRIRADGLSRWNQQGQRWSSTCGMDLDCSVELRDDTIVHRESYRGVIQSLAVFSRVTGAMTETMVAPGLSLQDRNGRFIRSATYSCTPVDSPAPATRRF